MFNSDHLPVTKSHQFNSTHPQQTCSKNGIFKKVYITNQLQNTQNVSEPRIVQEALVNPRWKQAMDKEYGALIRNKT